MILLWVIFAIIVGAIASSRGRSFVWWGFFTLVFSPIIGLIVVLAIGSKA